MKLKILGSGSSGNCYILESDCEALIIEAGLPFKEVKKALDFNIRKIVGVVVSHCHLDHAKYVAEYENAGIPVFKPYESEIERQVRAYGDFKIMSFSLPHNHVENRGFLIDASGQKILYMTDFEFCKYRFKNLKINHMIIECNYCKDLVDKNIPNYEHKLFGHCELETCKEFIRQNATSELRNIVLCHLSGRDSDPARMVSEVKKVSGNGTNIAVATAGLEVNLLRIPF